MRDHGISGMREQKTVTTPSGTTTTKSVWSGGQLAVELDSDGTRYTYLWGPGRIPLSVTARTAAGVSTTYAYHTDALGSVLAMTDAAGGVVARYTYDPWGRVTSATNSEIAARNPLRYRSYYLDAETGLYYMPARYYDPTTYRFLSVDPDAPSADDPSSLNAFVYCGDDPSSLNAFVYCGGDPVNAIDPGGARAEAGGGGGFDQWKIKNGDLAWLLVAHGWSKDDAYGFVYKQRKSKSHLAWREGQARREQRYREWLSLRDRLWRDQQEKERIHRSWALRPPSDGALAFDTVSTSVSLTSEALGGVGAIIALSAESGGTGALVVCGVFLVTSEVMSGASLVTRWKGYRANDGSVTKGELVLANMMYFTGADLFAPAVDIFLMSVWE